MRHIFGSMLIAAGLAALFWDPIVRGGGFVGGDVYSYFFPQKVFYAESLARGEWPLWNPLAGHGYPVLGESQTGLFYPPNVLLYRLLDVHTAYHVNHLLHYAMAWLFTVWLGRMLGLSPPAAMFAALVYVYSWFPVRSCWEWAILGGAWLPLALVCTERLLRTGRRNHAVWLAVVLSVQMLAGHFQIAFLTQLTVCAFCLFRAKTTAGPDHVASRGAYGSVAMAMLFGFLLSAVQLLPTAELKRNSQRAEFSSLHQPERGRVPWASFTQLAGWIRTPDGEAGGGGWAPYASPLVNRDASLQQLSGSVPTNQGEATLYFGLLPLGFAVIGGVFGVRQRAAASPFWLSVLIVSFVYATGWLAPVFKWLPGFGWFHGPGRWGILGSLAAGQLAGLGLDQLVRQAGPKPRIAMIVWMLFALVTLQSLSSDIAFVSEETGVESSLKWFGQVVSHGMVMWVLVSAVGVASLALWKMSGADCPEGRGGRTWSGAWFGAIALLTWLDLWMFSRLVTYAPMTIDPPLRHLAESPARRTLAGETDGSLATLRLHAPGGNLPTILGVASTPPYFTFGPAAYARTEDPPAGGNAGDAQRAEADFEGWLRGGVTHLLRFEPIPDALAGRVTLLWRGIDPFLNPAWARFREPVWLYRINEAPGRVRWEDNTDGPPGSLRIEEYHPGKVVIGAEANRSGRVMLMDLDYPGWAVEVDGSPAMKSGESALERGVQVSPGAHRIVWTYRPASVYWGGAVSLLAMAALGLMLLMERRRRQHAAIRPTAKAATT